MNVEGLLRETLQSRAAEAASTGNLVMEITVRSTRRLRRRRLAGATAAFAVAAVLISPAILRATGGGFGPAGVVSPGGGTATPSPEATLSPGVSPPPPPLPEPTGHTTLVAAGDVRPPDFPFTPGWAPDGLDGPHRDYDEQLNRDALAYYSPGGDIYSQDSGMVLWIEIRPTEANLGLDKLKVIFGSEDEDETAQPPPEPLTEQAVTVHGREARLLSNDELGVLGWRHAPGQWVMVWGRSAGEALRFAEELIEEPYPDEPPFTFEVVPAGAEVVRLSDGVVSFAPRTPTAASGAEVRLLRGGPGMELACPLSTQAAQGHLVPGWAGDLTAEDPCPLPREPVRVGDHDGEMVGDQMVVVYREGGLAVSVEAVGALSLSRDDLLRFAAGIGVTTSAVPAS